jgi:Abnormal spindle-like microcephaly-assoc'd, ASPM-SPD-2-Hydin
MDAPLTSSRCFTRLFTLALLLGLVSAVHAQNFSFFVNSTANPVAPNSDITASPTAIGASSKVTLLIVNGSNASWTISQANLTNLTGTAFALTPNPVGTVDGAGATVLVPITFAPATAGSLNGTLTLTLASGSETQVFNFFLVGVGQQPSFITSYILQPTGNQVAIATGGTLSFPSTNIGSTAAATFIISNTGTGPGIINTVNVTGSAFTISGLTLLPATVQPTSAVQFTITFQPTARGSASGSLSITFAGASAVNIQLSGLATGASLTYTLTVGSQSSTLAPGGTLSLPSTNVGSTVSAAITIVNGGDAAANIAAVTVVGAGYSVTNVPPTPATVSAGGSFTFTLVFSPQVSGTASGTLLIGAVSFPLSSVATGASLTYSSVIGSATASLANGGTVVFPNTNLGSTTTIAIVVANSGNTAGTIGGISVTGTGFSLTSLPGLPATVNPGASVRFSIVFTPTTTTTATGTLQIDAFSVSLRGVANQPAPISGVVFGSLSANAAPLQQPAVSLALSQPYPLPISGTLTLTFVSNSFADDPNIQFASGGRTANFTIPANSVNAVFGSTPQVQFQTGTVAGVITLTASLSVASASVTPNPAPAVQVTIPASAPVLSNVQLGATTANSFEVLITGLSTTRDVAALNLQFTPASGAQLQTTSLTVNSEAAFNTWFQSQTGISFGSQFTASVIVNVNGNGNAIQSVAVTASNSQGQSAPVSLSLSLN